MASNVRLALIEDDLTENTITLEGEGFDREEFNDYELVGEYTDLMVWVRRNDQIVIFIELDRFRELTERAVQELRDNPLPWVFTLESLGIREKPLEDVLLAVWKKFKGIRMEWE
jgi:hypothetical protein